jgi:hypothetical protein
MSPCPSEPSAFQGVVHSASLLLPRNLKIREQTTTSLFHLQHRAHGSSTQSGCLGWGLACCEGFGGCLLQRPAPRQQTGLSFRLSVPDTRFLVAIHQATSCESLLRQGLAPGWGSCAGPTDRNRRKDGPSNPVVQPIGCGLKLPPLGATCLSAMPIG